MLDDCLGDLLAAITLVAIGVVKHVFKEEHLNRFLER